MADSDPDLPSTGNAGALAPAAGAAPFAWQAQLGAFVSQPALKRSLPALLVLAAVGVAALVYFTIAAGPQRILYSDLSDSERADVAQALEKGGIDFSIDAGTGIVRVAEQDLYRARMLVASNSGLAVPQDASQMLDAIPLGSSRTLEGERLRLARERELVLTIQEIDGIDAARVHLATPEKSVFVRDKSAPSASVMVRLARGRTLSEEQVEAVVNIVAGSVPGLDARSVRVADQNGHLLSAKHDNARDQLTLQRSLEAKLQGQLAQLLAPMLGDGNFTSEVQIELNRNEVTTARESYDKDGALRSETANRSVRSEASGPSGIPGALSNTPPPPGQLADAPPRGGPASAPSTPQASDSETSSRRNYELGREVAVTSKPAGEINRLSVAVAINAAAMKKIAPVNEEKIRSLIASAVGADEARGDTVTVMTSKFDKVAIEEPPFYEATWFWTAMRSLGALVALILILLFAVRPLIKRIKAQGAAQREDSSGGSAPASSSDAATREITVDANAEDLPQQVELARKLAQAQPERAAAALQRMLAAPEGASR